MTGLQTPRGMSPRHVGMAGHQHQPHYNNGQQHHGYQYQPQQYMGGGHQPPHMGINPYANGGNGQNHVHVGLGGQGMNNGMGMGMNGHGPGHGQGMGMAMNVGMAIPGQYGQGPHPGLSIHGGEQGSLGKANQIWITGEFFGVQRARDMLLNVAMQKVSRGVGIAKGQSKLVISRDTAILPRKLDWLLTDRLEDVKRILSDNGTYMQVPSVGSQASLITVFGDHRINIERTIRTIMTLVSLYWPVC